MEDWYEKRSEVLKTIGFDSYEAYLESDLWAGIRRQVYRLKGVCCSCCRKKAKVIHHQSYDLSTLEGRTLAHLWPICRPCHKKVHFVRNERRTFSQAVQVFNGKLIVKPLPTSGSKRKKKKRKLTKHEKILRSMKRDKLKHEQSAKRWQ